MSRPRFRLPAPVRLRVGGKFLLTLGVTLPVVLGVVAASGRGLATMHAQTDLVYDQGVLGSRHAADVVADVYAVQETALYQAAVSDLQLSQTLTTNLDQVLIPDAIVAISVLTLDYPVGSAQRAKAEQVGAGLSDYLTLRSSGVFALTGPRSDADRTALAAQTDGLLAPVIKAANELRTTDARTGATAKSTSDALYRAAKLRVGLTGLAGFLLILGTVAILIRGMVPRIRQYSEFAAQVAAGQPTDPLRPRGNDELTGLGAALNDIVVQRAFASDAEAAQREATNWAEQDQAEFLDTLQVTSSEDEAQDLLQRHLQRSLPGSSVAVLRRNNSANRLQAATALPPDSDLLANLVGAEPRTCIAVRLGRTHREGTARPGLLSCALCEPPGRPATCEPLLVGGEVIGSVLVAHPESLSEPDDVQIKNTVSQAAPVLANLRSLALAEFRAANDSLTGLPNKRATEDTLKRMVAQAGRSVTPLTAVMLDLDHFKEINDRYGHAQGDEVLAAVGIAISSSLRDSDFAGRFGGEEFLVLLPDTDVRTAFQVAEKLRTGIAAITIPGIERDITASLGIAGLLEHAGNATGLLREADKAQYAAKAAGRNRSVVAMLPEDVGTEVTVQV